MRTLRTIALGAVVLLGHVSAVSAEVQLALHDGRVTLVAKDATVRQILEEWARVGQTTIVNTERIPGGAVTLQFADLPEEEALDILLRSVSGYVAAPRPSPVGNLSRYDRIMVMPTAPAPRVASAAAGQSLQQPAFAPAIPDAVGQIPPAPTVVTPARGPIFQTFPEPQVVNPAAGNSQVSELPAASDGPTPIPRRTVDPSAPVSVPRPGMATASPAPGQPTVSSPTAQPTPGR